MSGCSSTPNAQRPTPSKCDFIENKFHIQNQEWTVFSTRTQGPPVLLLHEISGLTHDTLALAQALSESPEKYKVYVPLLFGSWNTQRKLCNTLGTSFTRPWGKRWNVYSSDSLGSIIEEAAELSALIQKYNEGQKVFVIGNCLTASWPIALLGESSVSGGIICQPALPMLISTEKRQQALAVSDEELNTSAYEAKRQGKKMIGFCYLHDKFSPKATLNRFEYLKEIYGPHFTPYILATKEDKERCEVPSWAEWIEAGVSKEHSTLTRNAGLKHSIEREQLLKTTREFMAIQSSLHR